MHLVNDQDEPVRLQAGDHIKFRFKDSAVVLKPGYFFVNDRGLRMSELVLNRNGHCMVDPLHLMELLCSTLGFSFRLTRSNKQYYFFELIEDKLATSPRKRT